MSAEEAFPSDKFSTYWLDRHCVHIADDRPLDLEDAISSTEQLIISASYLKEILTQLQSGNTNVSSDSDESTDMFSEADEQISNMFSRLVEIHCHVENLCELQQAEDESDLENQAEGSNSDQQNEDSKNDTK